MPAFSDANQILDAYFLETRAKLLEIAANLDRIDRAPGAKTLAADPRIAFLWESLQILQSNTPNRTEKIQLLYSLK